MMRNPVGGPMPGKMHPDMPMGRNPVGGPGPGSMGTFKEGGDVPMTGHYKLHKGEKVLSETQKEHMKHAFGLASATLAHEKMPEAEHKMPKKRLKSIKTRRAKNGGYIMHHEHHAPHHMQEHDEEHVAANKDEMMKHMAAEQNQPEPPMEEAGEDPGQQQMEQAIGMK